MGGDHDADSDVYGELNAELDLDSELDIDADLDGEFEIDSDLDGDTDGGFGSDSLPVNDSAPFDTHIEFDHSGEIGIVQENRYEEKSKFLMGNIATFMLVWGQIGWVNSSNLQDIIFLYAIVGAYVASSVFGWVIANYTKTVIIPIIHVNRGDIGTVIYGISPSKPGIVHVIRKDGVETSIIARGAFAHDNFTKGEQGYVWKKDGELFTLTKGIKGMQQLYAADSVKKKALDSNNKQIKEITE